MRLSRWIGVPLFALAGTGLIIPNGNHQDDVVAGATVSNGTVDASPDLSTLEHEYQKLELLKHQLFSLHHEVAKQEHEIFLLLRKDFQTCQGVKCYVQTALQRAPDFFDLFKAHFQHPKNTTSGWTCPWHTTSQPDSGQLSLNSNGQIVYSDDSDDSNAPELDVPSAPVATTSQYAVHPTRSIADTFIPTITSSSTPTASTDPQITSRPSLFSTSAKAAAPTASSTTVNASKFGDFHMPNPAPRSKHYKVIVATTATVSSLLILALLIKGLHVVWANPRRRADIAARREERRTRREYRRAALKHHVRQVISRLQFWQSAEGSSDYEEKRETILQNENPQHVIGGNISSLQHAHEVVAQLIRAEEGRAYEPVSSSSRSLRSIRTVTTLPPYTPQLPKYSQDLGQDVEVIAGFEYTPTQSAEQATSSASSFVLDDVDLRTESSVVDCRSRFSIDTESTAPSQI